MDKLIALHNADEVVPSFSYSISADTSPSLPLTPNILSPNHNHIAWQQPLNSNQSDVSDHIDTTGTGPPPNYEWCIRGPELQSLHNAAHEQGFESAQFKLSDHPHKTIQTIPFKLELYPVHNLRNQETIWTMIQSQYIYPFGSQYIEWIFRRRCQFVSAEARVYGATTQRLQDPGLFSIEMQGNTDPVHHGGRVQL